MNSDICSKALEKVGNPNVLVNLVSKRVRQLTGSGPGSRPLIAETAGLGAGDIAMLELIHEKMDWELLEPMDIPEPPVSGKKKRS